MALTTEGAVRASRSSAELMAGLVVIGCLAVLLAMAVLGTDHRAQVGYRLNAGFTHIDGLVVGSDVRLAGVTVGQVVAETVDPKTFKANVVFTVRPDVKLPTDTAAIITSDSLLGGKYVALSPGANTKMLAAGGTMIQTQGSISLEQLLSRFIFSVTDTLTKANDNAAKSAPGTPAPASAPAPADGPATAPAAPMGELH